MWVGIAKDLCNQQIVVIFMAIDVTQKNIIDCYGTWYKSNHGSLMAMFGDLKHILDGSNFEDDGETMVMKGSLILIWSELWEGVQPMDEVGVFDKQINSFGN